MNSGFRLVLHKRAIKFLSKQERGVQKRIGIALDGLLKIPPTGDIRKMSNEPRKNLYRLRVGGFRIIFLMKHEDNVIYVQNIDNRGDVYKG